MRSLAAAIILLVWTIVPVGTVAVKVFFKPCHCPGHALPNGPVFSPCSSAELNTVKTGAINPVPPSAAWVAQAPAQQYPDSYLQPKPGPSTRPATPPPKV